MDKDREFLICHADIFSLIRRLAENSKLQSNVKYHAEFEAAKGKFTQIADDPETQRIKANSQVIRSVSRASHLDQISRAHLHVMLWATD